MAEYDLRIMFPPCWKPADTPSAGGETARPCNASDPQEGRV